MPSTYTPAVPRTALVAAATSAPATPTAATDLADLPTATAAPAGRATPTNLAGVPAAAALRPSAQSAGAPPIPELLTASRPVPRWRWPLPVHPEITRRFDPPSTPYGPGHRGVDLAAAPGTPVLAAGSGVVAWAGILAGRGVVSVRHAGGLRTTYEPVSTAVRAGQPVTAGDRLGLLAPGHPGCPRPACLHWGLLGGDVYLDPLRLLGRGPVRLLPLARPAASATSAADSRPGSIAPAATAHSAASRVPTQQTAVVAFCFACTGLVLIRNRRWPP